MESSINKAIHLALKKILSALCRILLRHSVSSGVFVELFKRAYVEAARKELGIRGREANKSKIAAAVGLSRKEVARLCLELDQESTKIQDFEFQHNRNIRLIHTWMTDPTYTHDDSVAKAIPLEGESPSFQHLVKNLGADISTNAMLQELMRSGVVRKNDAGYLYIDEAGFIPSDDELSHINILGTDVNLLLNTIQHNISQDSALFQRKVAFHNVNEDGMKLIEKMAREDGQKLLEKINALLPDYIGDKDDKNTHFSGLGIFSFKEKKV